MRILITCGPAWEPLDGARRLTNHSTGRLGARLAEAFGAAGAEVSCLRGEGATHPAPRGVAALEGFTTNDDLAARLERLGRRRRFDAVLHAAALCDFRVARVTDSAGADARGAKITSRAGVLRLELEPATKVLPRLRGWFPGARIVGWKYELAGTPAEALALAWRQVREDGVDACVLNGAAHGPGFALCRGDGGIERCRHAAALAAALWGWLARRPEPKRVAPPASRVRVPMISWNAELCPA